MPRSARPRTSSPTVVTAATPTPSATQAATQAATHPVLAAQPGPPDPLAFQLLNEVGIIGQLSGTRATQLLAPGLNLSQFSVLNHFTRLGGERSLVQLASAMQVSKAAMTNTIARLQDKGLLAVRPDPADGRGKRVSLTSAGLAARQAAVGQLGQGLSALNGLVSDAEWRQALGVLRQLRQWFDSNR